MDVAGRAGRLRDLLDREGIDGLVVTSPGNIRYLTGFTGSAGVLLVLADELVFVSDGRYGTQSREQMDAAGVDARVEIGLVAAQEKALAAAVSGGARIGLEAGHITWARQRAWAAGWLDGGEVVPTEGIVEELRRVKDEGEVARMRRAAACADAALEAVKPMLLAGAAERDIAIALDHEMRHEGADAPSFDTIVASGPNAAKPHARPSPRPVESGELVVIDFGARVDGYCSDMTRTLCVGEPQSAELVRMVEVVAASQRAGVAAVRAGVACAEVDRACRAVIEAAGWGDAFVHGTGHGVGLDIHEHPAVSSVSGDTLAAGFVVTVEPGVYLPGTGGVRIEDTVVVTQDGSYPITLSAKDLIVS